MSEPSERLDPARIDGALSSDDAEVRRSAIAAVAALSGREATGLLLRGLADADWRVRKEAARVAIEHLAARAALLPALVEALEAPSAVGLHNSAAEVLVGMGVAAVPVLLARLASLPPAARRFALEALGDIGDPAATSALLASCQDDDPNLRAAAIEALGRVGGPEASRALAGIVEREADPFLRLAALESSQRAGASLPVALLAELSEDRILRRAAVAALGRTGDAGALAPLSRALRDHARSTASAAALALAQLAETGGLAESVRAGLRGLGAAELGLFGDLVRAGNLTERQAAVVLLGLCDREDATALLAQAAADDDLAALVDAALRRRGPNAAAALLASIPDVPGRALPVLLPILADLARGAPTEAGVRARLVEIVGHEDDGVAGAAAECLGALDAVEATAALVGRLQHGSPRVARACAQALGSIGGRHARAVRDALGAADLEGRAGPLVAGLLGTVGDAGDVIALRAALGSEDVALRRASVDALSRLGGEAAAEAVILALADENEDVQAAAATALGRTGGRRAVESLLAALTGSGPHVVAAAARALGELVEADAAEPLRALVTSEHGMVAVAALEALRRLADRGRAGDLDEAILDAALAHDDPEVAKRALGLAAHGEPSRAIARLARALEHPAWDVRRTAADLLGRLRDPSATAALTRRSRVETDPMVRGALEEALAGR